MCELEIEPRSTLEEQPASNPQVVSPALVLGSCTFKVKLLSPFPLRVESLASALFKSVSGTSLTVSYYTVKI